MNSEHALLTKLCPNLTCGREMEPQKAGTPEQAFCGSWWRCPRCHSAVLLPSPELEAQLASQRASAARSAAKRDPLIRAGFEAWVANEAYWDGRGYRLLADKRRRAVWSAAVVALYPNLADFHEAARMAYAPRLEAAPMVRESVITPSEPEPVIDLMRRRESEVRAGLFSE